jgi:hypothetical protein
MIANDSARFMGPGVNQFQQWNGRNEESGDSPSEEEKNPEPKKASLHEEDDEGWTDWKNGEDIKNRFNSKKNAARIIHLRDGSELLTDRNVGDDDNPNNDSSTEEDSDEEESDGMHIDGVKHSSEKLTSKAAILDDSENSLETRHKSPTPTSEASKSPSHE